MDFEIQAHDLDCREFPKSSKSIRNFVPEKVADPGRPVVARIVAERPD
jgi:hypothetical protein